MDHGCRRFRFFHIIVAVIVALMICGIKAGPGLFRNWHFPTAISSTGYSGNKARIEVHFSPSGACSEACVVIRDLTYMRNWAEDREYSEQYQGRQQEGMLPKGDAKNHNPAG
jgi:hypothetical protein